MTCGHECKCSGCCGCGIESSPALILPVSCTGADLLDVAVKLADHPGVDRAEADVEQGCLWVWCDDREVALEDLKKVLEKQGCLPDEASIGEEG